MNSSFSCNCNCRCENKVFRFKNIPFIPICSCCCLPKPQPVCPPATLLCEEQVCEKRRAAFEAGNIHFFNNPDPFGVDYEYYFVNDLASAQQPCNEFPGFNRPTLEEADLLTASFLVDGKPLCPMLFWINLNGEPMLKNSAGSQGSFITPPSPLCKAYRICVKPILT